MLVVSDTGPIRYLVEIGVEAVLPKLFDEISTVPEVVQELRLPHFPPAVQQWAQLPPAWLKIESPSTVSVVPDLAQAEAAAIALAVERRATLVLVDERRATAYALQQGLAAYGTLGVLIRAGARGYLDYDQVVSDLMSNTRFRCLPAVLQVARAEYLALERETGSNPSSPGAP
jgi:predicted nucleic acid-binding protein